ncbi:TPA: hemolysin expression modulator Hha [Escherichia coli]|nr:hemolysin expression modulator Hha [Escherichia coli]
MAKTKQEWLYQLRRCSSLKTLEKIIAKNQGTLTSDKIETFNSAVEHRLAELTMNKLYDKVPASVWKYVK